MNSGLKRQKRIIRHRRVRAKVSGTKSRPRLAVFRSNRYVHLQLIDDSAGQTLTQASSREVAKAEKTERIGQTAKLLAERAGKLGITAMVFDRGGYQFHGQVKKVATVLKESGIEV